MTDVLCHFFAKLEATDVWRERERRVIAWCVHKYRENREVRMIVCVQIQQITWYSPKSKSKGDTIVMEGYCLLVWGSMRFEKIQ